MGKTHTFTAEFPSKSPFDKGLIKELAYKLYYDILGDYRFEENKKSKMHALCLAA